LPAGDRKQMGKSAPSAFQESGTLPPLRLLLVLCIKYSVKI